MLAKHLSKASPKDASPPKKVTAKEAAAKEAEKETLKQYINFVKSQPK